MTDLIERLLAMGRSHSYIDAGGSVRTVDWPTNPDGPEAATILERQAALLAEAREALSDCAEVLDYVTPDGTDFDMSVDTTRTRARSVLKSLEVEGADL